MPGFFGAEAILPSKILVRACRDGRRPPAPKEDKRSKEDTAGSGPAVPCSDQIIRLLEQDDAAEADLEILALLGLRIA